MNNETIDQYLQKISDLIDRGELDLAESYTDFLYEAADVPEKSELHIALLSNIASFYTDIGHLKPSDTASKLGLKIFNSYKEQIIQLIGEDSFFYNLGNAKSNLIKEKNPFNHTFSTIEDLISMKSDFWKATKIFNEKNPDHIMPEYLVNLGNSLKQQFRLIEALQCYDQVNTLSGNIPQAWINRSDTLALLHLISNTYSIEMLQQIKHGYEKAISLNSLPPNFLPFYESKILFYKKKIDEICNEDNITLDTHEEETTQKEFEELSDYRKFCLQNHLTLSEHGLYCGCVGSARDNLTIPTLSGISGDFVIPMEMILNRLKSEFSFARHLFFDYIIGGENEELLHESCFSELFNDEILGLDVEKLRTSFKLCFGILDKIAVAICDLYDLSPSNKTMIYFQNFWQLDQGNRREKFNSYNNPGLLALYSIATDLNNRKDGEWSFLKDLRNKLEHQFVVVHKYDQPNDIYDSFSLLKDIEFIQEGVFISHLQQILQLTRSAIFSFVFAVRDKAINEENKEHIYTTNKIYSKDFV